MQSRPVEQPRLLLPLTQRISKTMSESLKSHRVQALGLAIVIEVVLLSIAAAIIAWAATMKPAQSEPIPIVLSSVEQAPQSKPEPPKPKPKLDTPPPVATPQAPPPPVPVEPPVTPPAVPVPTAFTEPVPPPPPPTSAPSVDKAKPSAEYAAKVRAAVQAAHYYPPAAIALGYSGRVRVEFHLHDKVPGEPHLLVASGLGIIDRAALQAVKSAQYPEPPPELAGTDIVYQVWVEFSL